MFVRTEFAAGAWWQLVSAQWVHLSWLHAGVNLLGLLVLLWAFRHRVDGRLQALALLGGGVGVALAVALDSRCATYAGASGALHGLLAGGALGLGLTYAAPGSRLTPTRVLAAAILAALALKLILQHQGTGDVPTVGWLGFEIYTPAHEAGALGGVVAVLLARSSGRHWFGEAAGR